MHCHEWSPGHNNIHTMMNILCSFYFIYIFSINGIYFYQFLYIRVDTKVNVSASAYVVLAHLHCWTDSDSHLIFVFSVRPTPILFFSAANLMVIIQVREQYVAALQSTLENFQGRSDICFILPGCLQPGITVVCLVSSQHWQKIQHTQVFTPSSESAILVESLSVLLPYHTRTTELGNHLFLLVAIALCAVLNLQNNQLNMQCFKNIYQVCRIHHYIFIWSALVGGVVVPQITACSASSQFGSSLFLPNTMEPLCCRIMTGQWKNHKMFCIYWSGKI